MRDVLKSDAVAVGSNEVNATELTSQPELARRRLCRKDYPEGQVARLEKIFEMLGKPARRKKCPAIEGIIEEAEEMIKEAETNTVRDAGMLAAAQAVEHYEISRYGNP
jgi:ferritin-like metal-binding protein YciE